MSLIERAVQKIGEGADRAPGLKGPVPVDAPDRAGAGALRVEAGPQAVAPAAVAPPPVVSVVAPPATIAPPPNVPPEPAVAPASNEPAAPGALAPLRIDLKSLRARGYLIPDDTPTSLSQQFRVIKRPLLTNAFGRGGLTVTNGKRVMVTSTLPGEGKSFCAINLALSIAAERDHAVLLVDADVAKPTLPKELGIPATAGLMDWLVDGQPDLDALIRPTNIDKLSILTAGRKHEHSTEYIASASMTRLLDQLSTRYPERIIVFDSPPLLATTEARLLATYMGQIVMVVEAGRTPRAALAEALATIESCEVVGLVLNKSEQHSGSGGYGYGGYGYGYGSE